MKINSESPIYGCFQVNKKIPPPAYIIRRKVVFWALSSKHRGSINSKGSSSNHHFSWENSLLNFRASKLTSEDFAEPQIAHHPTFLGSNPKNVNPQNSSTNEHFETSNPCFWSWKLWMIRIPLNFTVHPSDCTPPPARWIRKAPQYPS